MKGAASPSGKGANVKVDGVQDAGNRTFTQAKGATHALGTPRPPAAGDGYTDDSRTDGGGQSLAILPQSDATYTAAQEAAQTLYVDDDYTPATPGWGVDHFATIQDGIAAAAGGDTVEVAQGTYVETSVSGGGPSPSAAPTRTTPPSWPQRLSTATRPVVWWRSTAVKGRIPSSKALRFRTAGRTRAEALGAGVRPRPSKPM